MKRFYVRTVFETWNRAVALNQFDNFRIVPLRRLKPDQTLSRLEFAFAIKIIYRREPSVVDNDVVVQKCQDIAARRLNRSVKRSGFSRSNDLYHPHCRRKIRCDRGNKIVGVVIGVIVGDDDLRIDTIQTVKTPKTSKQLAENFGAILSRDDNRQPNFRFLQLFCKFRGAERLGSRYVSVRRRCQTVLDSLSDWYRIYECNQIAAREIRIDLSLSHEIPISVP